MTAWVVLSTKWSLQDVQAGLNVVINVLCIIFTFTSSRYFWQKAAKKVTQGRDTHLTALLTLGTPGEIIDVIETFKTLLLRSRYAILSIQGFIIVFFGLAAMFAGPITRYSTRVGEITTKQLVHGRQATRSSSCDVNDVYVWHQAYTALENANFPLDRLLDFIPDNDTNWAYDTEDWDETYSLACSFTPQTTVNLNATGSYVNDSLLYMYDEIPGLWDILSPRFQRDDIIHDYFYDGIRDPDNGVWDEVIVWDYVVIEPSNVTNQDNATTQWQTLAFTLAATYMANAPDYNLSAVVEGARDWVFGIGPIPQSFYTKVECDIKRNRPAGDSNYYEAYPELTTNCDLAQQTDVYWSPTAVQPATTSYDGRQIVNLPSGEEILRFYQAWMISKDTWYPNKASRRVSVRQSTVELSLVFIVICGLLILIVFIGLVYCLAFTLRHGKMLRGVPQTKIDWLLQALKEAQAAASSKTDPEEALKEARFQWQTDQGMKGKGLGRIWTNGNSIIVGASLTGEDHTHEQADTTKAPIAIMTMERKEEPEEQRSDTATKVLTRTTSERESLRENGMSEATIQEPRERPASTLT
jgi:hypothetical protein